MSPCPSAKTTEIIVQPSRVSRSDEELGQLDVADLLRDGFGTVGAAHREFFADGAVAAAIAADRHGVFPRSITFLAEVVRRGGIGYAADLPEPLPRPDQAELVREWLNAARELARSTDGASNDRASNDEGANDELARWLEAVAVILDTRHRANNPRG
jgi:hypothetical protein